MAEPYPELVLSGVLHGLSNAVAGGLITAEESQYADGLLPKAQELSVQIVQAQPVDDLAPWRQIMIGELVGTAVAARTVAGTMDDLPAVADISSVLDDIWRIIDRF